MFILRSILAIVNRHAFVLLNANVSSTVIFVGLKLISEAEDLRVISWPEVLKHTSLIPTSLTVNPQAPSTDEVATNVESEMTTNQYRIN